MTIYVEGGGDTASLKSQCRRAFSELIHHAGFDKRMPSIKAMGGRQFAFDAFKIAHKLAGKGDFVLFLVDGESISADPG